MSRIHEALEKSRQEREETKGVAHNIGKTPAGSVSTLQPVDLRKAESELAKQGLVYKVHPVVVCYHEPDSMICEEYRIMRTNFLSMAQDVSGKKQIKSVVISSANRREGKSVTAANFAMSLAHDGQRKILLIDCDFRRPSISKLLGVRPQHDIISVLTKDVPIEKAIIPTPLPQLNVMTVTHHPPNPAELVGSPKMKRLMSLLRGMYDVVVCDTPPIMAVTDAVVLGSSVDGVILVVQARQTQRERIRDAEDLLKQAHANMLGYVLTDVRTYIPRYFQRFQYYTTYSYVEK